jgi:predicted HicB family RNase H-like nuclease
MSENPNNKKMMLRVPKLLHLRAKEQCRKEKISMNKKVLTLLEREFGENR